MVVEERSSRSRMAAARTWSAKISPHSPQDLFEAKMKRTKANRSGSLAAILIALLLTAPILLASCTGTSGEPRSTVDLAPFKALARSGGCADIRNRLFLIDSQLVLWDRAGNCADAAYGQTLYGSTPDQVLCVYQDSIAGPVKNCQDAGHQDMFDMITENLEKPDLGLGAGHTVQSVQF
jgi:hypothetical protein